MAELRHAAYCGTRNLYDDMETAAKSLVANSSVGIVHMFIEDEDMGRELPSIVQCHDVSGQAYFRPEGPNMRSCFSHMAMMRAALCYELPYVRKVLSLDADTVCVSDVDGIWELPMDGCYFAASSEWHKSGNGLLYCNHGVVLYDLRMMHDGKAAEVIDVLNRRQYTWVEQDVCNYLCQGRIYDMPAQFNSCWWTDKNADGAAIRHFAGVSREQWTSDPDVLRWRKATWDEVLHLHERHIGALAER